MDAANLLTQAGWIVDSGGVAITSGSAVFLPGQSGADTLQQSFATVPGTTCILRFEYENLPKDEEFEVTLSGSGFAILNLWHPLYPSNVFAVQTLAFTANSTSTTIVFNTDAEGTAILDLANISVSAGSFTRPGKYTGTETITQSLPGANISSSRTNSVVARGTAIFN